MDDLRKLKDQAAKLAEKRNYAKAAELYLQIAQAEPDDPDWRQRAGEALRKEADHAGAAAQFKLAAEGYAKAGFLLKAIAVCKLVLQLDPGHTATQRLLTDLYAQRDVRPGAPPPLPAPAPAPPPLRIQPDPRVPLGLEAVPLDQRTVPSGSPLEVVPLATVLSATKSGQFLLVLPDEATPDIAPEASAYEISLDDILEEITIPPDPAALLAAPTPEVGIERLDDQISLSGLFREAVATPAPPPLPKIPLFSSLAPDRLQRLIERVEVRDFDSGVPVVREGERGGSLFVIVSGAVRVMVGAREVAKLGEGEFFGEQAILTDQPRTATVVTTAPTQLLELSRQLVSELVADSPEVLRTLLRFFRDRLVERLLGTSALFSSLNPEDAHTLADRFLFLELEPKMRLVRQDERAPGLFLLLAGEAQVMMGPARIAALAPGDVFGEMSLLGSKAAMASIVTVSKCWALELPAKQFQEIMLSYPQILAYVSELAEKRAADNDRIDLL